MTVLAMRYQAADVLTGQAEKANGPHCLYCGKRLGFLRRALTGSRFCADEHQKTWALRRLTRVLATD